MTPDPNTDPQRAMIEYLKCQMNPAYFINTYCQITDPNRVGNWFPFTLWPQQRRALSEIEQEKRIVALKARQLGITWLALAYALWQMLFKTGASVLTFSRTGDDAASHILRITGMWERLPDFLRIRETKANEKSLILNNGSHIKAFTTTKHSGRGETASLVIIDEGAFIDFLRQLLNAAEETMDAGGQLILLSTNDKAKPHNHFAKTYRAAIAGANGYHPLFLSWKARPTRTADWYAEKVATKEQDDLWQEYPETAEQALAGRTASKRFNPKYLMGCYAETAVSTDAGIPPLPGLTIYKTPTLGNRYLIAADTAEGDPTSDPSPATVFDVETWEEVGVINGRFEPDTYADYLTQLGGWYNYATICVERNNHGHAVNLALKAADYPAIYKNPHDKKLGWLTNAKWKTAAVNKTAAYFKDGSATVRTAATLHELMNLEASTLKAPEGDTDDLALSFIIGMAALTWPSRHGLVGSGFAVKGR